MDTQALQAFLAVSQHESFSQAGEQLHLTQSAISKRIQLLEAQLGVALFDRHNRTTSLTEAGQTLLPKAQHILALINDTVLEVQNLKLEVSGKLSLATSHHIGLHRLPPILREFTARYPKAELDLRFMGSERAYQAVSQRQVELALSTLDSLSLTDHSELTTQQLWQDDMQCVCSPLHPLSQISALKLQDLSLHPAILPEPDTITFKMLERVFTSAQLPLHAPMPTNYLETIKMMVSVGMGWSMLPRTMLDTSLHSLDWPAAQLLRPLGLVQLKTRTLSNAAKAFIEILRENTDNLT